MDKTPRGKSSNYLQNRILIMILLFTAAIGVIVTAMSSYLYKHYLQKALLQTAESNLNFLCDNVDNNIENIKRLVNFCQTNTTIVQFAEVGKGPGSLSLNAYNRLNEECQANESKNFLHRVLVASNTDSYLQIVSNAFSNSRNAAVTARNFPYFEELLNNRDPLFTTGFVKDGLYEGKIPTRVLPLLRPIYARYNADYSGWILIYISEKLFTAPLAYYSPAEDSELFLTIGDHIYRLTPEGCADAEDTYTVRELSESGFLNEGTKVCSLVREDGVRESMVITRPLKQMKNCYISQTISPKSLSTQRTLFLTTVSAIILLIVVIGLIVSYLLYRSISLPVLKIRAKVTRISQGDFSRDPSIEWNHELGEIGRGINEMSENIVGLLDRRLEDEKQKRDLEYKMLQSQINPHFLYNTLNSIKWMASIQGADGIAEMTTALSRLLRSISKGTSLLVPLGEELSLLSDYFTIQQYRYGGTITLTIHVEEEALYDCLIVKFTLQPLVENAIFHGIEPKGSAGTITVTAARAGEGRVRVVVEDDGVGMSPEKASRLLEDDSDRPAEFFREIGVSNVHKRLQYEFGPEYGITIETGEGEYTRMILLFPEKCELRKEP